MNRIIATALVPFAAACGGDTGLIAFDTWGEAYIEERIPAEAFEDGWSIEFSKFLIALSGIEVKDRDGKIATSVQDQWVFDMTLPGPTAIFSASAVDAQRYEHVSARVEPAGAAAVAGGMTAAADVERMKTGAHSVLVAGVATSSSGATKRFEWAFDTATIYSDCAAAEGGEGIVVPSGGNVGAQLTVHGDHFFYDDLQSPDAKLRFSAIARADADGDGDVTLAELAAVKLEDLPSTQYRPGTAPNVRNLADFVRELTRTLVHFQGEGECQSRPL